MERELRLAERAGRGFALLMLDLDGLKPVNDSFGHHYGDRLLQAITEVIQRNVRATDTPARYGGDEFVILLPDTDASGGFVVAEKLRKDIGGLSIRVNERSVHTSVSIGLVAYPDDGGTVEELMAAVDAALYEAKRSGKDRIVGYTTRTERVATRMGTAGRESVTRDTGRGDQGPRDPGGEPPAPPDDPGRGPGADRLGLGLGSEHGLRLRAGLRCGPGTLGDQHPVDPPAASAPHAEPAAGHHRPTRTPAARALERGGRPHPGIRPATGTPSSDARPTGYRAHPV